MGADVHFPPEADKDLDGYDEMFVVGPDRLRVEIACGPPE
jgi:hypothetical protein